MMEKDNNLLHGKGEDDVEWITVNGSHVPIKDGQTPQEAIKNHFANKSKVERSKSEDVRKSEAIKHLIDTLKKIKKIKTKELHNYIRSLNPVKLQINDGEIIAEFDRFSADKNIYGQGRSDKSGYDYKLSNPTQIPKIVESSKYSYSQKEQGKDTQQHKGVKQWHYFTNEIQTENGNFNVVVNVRDKGENQFVYEIAIKKKKT